MGACVSIFESLRRASGLFGGVLGSLWFMLNIGF